VRETKREDEECESRQIEANCVSRFSHWVVDLVQNDLMRRGLSYPLKEVNPVKNVSPQFEDKNEVEKEGDEELEKQNVEEEERS